MKPFADRVCQFPGGPIHAHLSVLVAAFALGGCAGAPETNGTPPPAVDAGQPSLEDGKVAAASHKEEPLYNLASGEIADGSAALEAEWEARAVSREDSQAIARRMRQSQEAHLTQAPETALVGELHSRWSREWAELSGGLGTMPSALDLGRRQKTAGKLVAMAFLRDEAGASDDAIAQAATFIEQDASRRDLSLLAAAAHQHRGDESAVNRLLGGLGYCPVPATSGSGATAPEAAPFEVVGLTFAASIEGPGKFIPLDPEEVAPGKTVLVYGELRNFTSVRDASDQAGKPLYRRAFQASLRLLTHNDEEVDHLEFLPEKRGRQTAATLSEVMNFWARYRLPANLKPGNYKLIIDARDVLGSSPASAELPVEIRGN